MSNGNKRPLGISEYIGSQVYKDICDRFFKRHHINFPDQVAEISEVGKTLGTDIKFKPKNASAFASLLRLPSFAPDDKSNLCGWIASGKTKGQGYREVGVPSLHVAVAPDSKPTRFTPGACAAMNAAIASGSDTTTPSLTTVPSLSTTQTLVVFSDTSNPTYISIFLSSRLM